MNYVQNVNREREWGSHGSRFVFLILVALTSAENRQPP